MKVVFQHPSVIPVKNYGGTERILFWHMCELVKQGHEVVYIGPPESKVEEYGIKLISHPPHDDKTWVTKIPKDADVLHLQYNDKRDFGLPTLFTVHGNGQPGEEFPKNSVFVSESHAKNHGSTHFVHNALNFEEYPYTAGTKQISTFNSFSFLAKASWKVKNLKSCTKVCRKLKKDLHVMGGRYFWPSRYIHSHGMVNNDQKIEIINKTDGLLFPVRWHEPFGIAIIEAMALGRPVFGSHYGSLPELINRDVGRTYQSEEEMGESLATDPGSYSCEKIREYAVENFSIEKTTKKYISFYDKVINEKEISNVGPKWVNSKEPQALLDF